MAITLPRSMCSLRFFRCSYRTIHGNLSSPTYCSVLYSSVRKAQLFPFVLSLSSDTGWNRGFQVFFSNKETLVGGMFSFSIPNKEHSHGNSWQNQRTLEKLYAAIRKSVALSWNKLVIIRAPGLYHIYKCDITLVPCYNLYI